MGNAPIAIDDPADPRLDDFRDLSVADRRPDTTRGVVIAEGVPVAARMLSSRFTPHAVMGVPARLAKLAALAPAVQRYAVSAPLMTEVVGFQVSRGVLAAARRPHPLDPAALLHGARTVVIVEGVNDHENLGALFRNAAGLGADAVLFGPRCSDPLYRRAVRVSMGHVLRVPFAHLDPAGWPESGLGIARAHGLRVVALTPGGETPLAEAAGFDKVALLIGAEGPGLAPQTLAAADVRAAIDMARETDSLNVATAAAIALYERRR